MTRKLVISLFFSLAALYDGLLGLVFLFAGNAVFQWFNVTPPNHIGYVQYDTFNNIP